MSGLNPVGFPVLARGHTGLFLEKPDERRSIGVADFCYDFLHIGVGFPQKLHGLFHFNVGHIVRNTDAGVLPENLSHAGRRNGEMLGDGADLEVIREAMLLDILHKLWAQIRLGCDCLGCADGILDNPLQRGEEFVDVVVVCQFGDVQIVRRRIGVANVHKCGHFLQNGERVIADVFCRVQRTVGGFGISIQPVDGFRSCLCILRQQGRSQQADVLCGINQLGLITAFQLLVLPWAE